MLENIMLISQTHERLSATQAQEKALLALKALNLSHIASYRYISCNAQEKFLTQLIRANMLKDAKIIIEQPFHLLDEHLNVDLILSTMEKLKIDIHRVHIIDLKHMQAYYEGGKCLIKKY